MKKNVIRLLMSLVAMLTMGNVAFAENKLWIEQQNGGVMAVMLDNDPSAAAVQFQLALPEGVDVVPTLYNGSLSWVYPNAERLSNGQRLSVSAKDKDGVAVNAESPEYNRVVTMRCMIASMNRNAFVGTEGAIAYFRIQRSTSHPVEIKLSQVEVSTASGTILSSTSENFNGVISATDVQVYTGDLDGQPMYVNPNTTFKLPIELRNSNKLSSIQMDIQLPDGFTMDSNFEPTSRLDASTGFGFFPDMANSSLYRITLSNIGQNIVVPEVGDGVIFYANVTAPATFPSTSSLVIKNVIAAVSNAEFSDVNGSGCTVSVVNGDVAYQSAKTAIATLNSNFAPVKESITSLEEKYPALKDVFAEDVQAIENAISTLESNVDSKYENLTLTPYVDSGDFNTDVEAIQTLIDTLKGKVESADSAESARIAKINEQYNALVNTEGEGLLLIKANYEDVKTYLESDEMKPYADAEAIAKVGQDIEDAFAEAKNLYDAAIATADGEFVFPAETLQNLSNAVSELKNAADAKKAEAEGEDARKKANEAAYNAVVAQLDDLQAELDAAKAEAEKEYPGFTPETEISTAQGLIDGERTQAKELYDAVAEAGVYEDEVDETAIKDAIAQIVPAAAALAEGNRVATNAAAYKADLDAIKTLEANLRTVKATLLADYKGIDMTVETLAVENAIKDAKDAADKENEETATEGFYQKQVDQNALQDMIDNLLVVAKEKADQSAADKAEQERQEANLAAYNKAIADIAALQTELNNAAEDVKAYPAYDATDAIAAIQTTINGLTAAADAEKARVATEGTYSYTVDPQPVQTAIAAMLAAAKDAQDKADADKDAEEKRQEANLAAYNKAIADIAALQTELNNAAEDVKAYPAYDATDAIAAIQTTINGLTAAAEAEKTRVATEGTYSYTVDPQPVQNAIAAMLAAAKAAQDKADADDLAKANENAYNAVVAQIDALQTKLNEAKATIAEKYPAYTAVETAAAAIETLINAERSAAKTTYDAAQANGVAFSYTVKVDNIDNAIAQMLADAAKAQADADQAAADKAEQERKDNNQKLYDAAVADINALQAALDKAAEDVKAYPAYDSTDAVAAIQAQIDALKADAKNALDTANATAGATFNYTVDGTAVNKAIADMIAAAKAAQDKADSDKAEQDRKDANKAAYDKDMNLIDELFADFRSVCAEINKDYKEFEDLGAENVVKLDLEAAEKAVKNAYEKVASEGTYTTPAAFNYEALKAAITKLLTDAQQKKADKEAAEAAAEQQRVDNNNAAYEAAMTQLLEIQNHYNATVKTIQTDYADYEDKAAEQNVQAQIDAAKAAAKAALDAVANEGTFSYTVPAEALTNAIDALLNKAIADKKAADDKAEQERLARVQAAYEQALAQVNDLQDALTAMVNKITTDLPGYLDGDAATEVQEMINQAQNQVVDAYNKAMNEGGEYTFVVPVNAITDAINDLYTQAEAAKKAAEDKAEADRVAANKAAYDAVCAEIAKVQAHLDAVKADIAANYSGYEDKDAIATVQDGINAAQDGADNALAAVEKAGNFDYTFDNRPLDQAIDDILAEAIAAKAAADDAAAAEAARQEANKADYDADKAAIDALLKKYNATIEDIEANYADYVDVKAEAKVLSDINAANTKVEEAYAAVKEAGRYASPLDADALDAEIDALLKDAQDKKAAADKAAADEAERVAANKAAYEKALNDIAALQAELDKAAEDVKAYPAYDAAAAIDAIQTKINALKAAADAALAAVEKEGLFDYAVDGTAVKADIAKMLEDAKAAQDKADADAAEAARKAANEAAYNAVLEALAEIQNHYNDVVAQVESEYPAYVDADANAAVQAQIDAAKAAADAAYAAVAEEGRFDYELDADALNAAINKLLTDAEAKAKHDQEVEDARKAANEAAYNAVLSTLAEVQAYFDETVADIKANLAIFSDPDANAAVQAKIDAVKAAADAAYAAVENEGNFDYTVDVVPLYEAIDALADNAEAARVTYNEDSYNVVMTVIESLQAQFEAARESIITEYPTYDYFAEATEINNAINAAKAGADAALEAVAEAGLFKYNFDADAIRKMIDEMLANAVKSGVSMVEIENGEVMIFTLDGKRHFNLVQGEVNVIVRKNGEREKVMVK
ncbi:MAG: hypothetical protein NC095_01560 [Muribaculum sp.]|nr:hypothetical protein [Muribaculum sp.]